MLLYWILQKIILGSSVSGSRKGLLAELYNYQFLTAQSWQLQYHKPLHIKLQSTYPVQWLSSTESSWLTHTFDFSTRKCLPLLALSAEQASKKLCLRRITESWHILGWKGLPRIITCICFHGFEYLRTLINHSSSSTERWLRLLACTAHKRLQLMS